MKLYLLTNMYCGGQHPGIQGQHATVRLMTKYLHNDDYPVLKKQVLDWAMNHETTVLLNSGMGHPDLQDLLLNLDSNELSKNNHAAFASFQEPGMNNSITSIAVLCSTEMVNDMGLLRSGLRSEEHIVKQYGKVIGDLLIKMAYMRTV